MSHTETSPFLPVATGPQVREYATGMVRRNSRTLTLVIVLQTLGAIAGLAGPAVVGQLVDALTAGTTATYITTMVALLAGALLTQAVLVRFARLHAMVLGEKAFAELREDFLSTVTSLPLSIVERSGTGDLVSRTTHDINRVQHTVRFGVPQILVSTATVLMTLIATIAVSPPVALAVFAGSPLLIGVARWYLRRAAPRYLAESASYARTYADITETVDGAHTVETLNLASQRVALLEQDITNSIAAERRTVNLRTVLIPGMDFAFALAPITVLIWGAVMVSGGHATVGAVTTVLLYAIQMIGPIWDLVFWLDETQVAATSMARIIGVHHIAQDRTATGAQPSHEVINAHNVTYAYREGHNVLHSVSLALTPGERLAVVGPSGAGKSTLGRMLAGIHPPTAGTVTVGDVPLVDLTVNDLRTHVALVTQEHHVFVGTLAHNITLADPHATHHDARRALDAVGALSWVDELPEGLDTEVGSGGHPLSPAQAQQIALARLIILDPHTLILDEATSLLDPRAARDLERSMASVLTGRTVIAIAHRLHTAHDADRVAVVDGGKITELGSHDELVARQGSYANLWHSWQQDSVTSPPTSPRT